MKGLLQHHINKDKQLNGSDDKWRNISLNMLADRFEKASWFTYNPVGDFNKTKEEVKPASLQSLLAVFQEQLLKNSNAKKQDWGQWIGLRMSFTVSEKQCEILRENLGNDNNILVHSIALGKNFYLMPHIGSVNRSKHGKFYIIALYAFYSEHEKFKNRLPFRQPTI